MAVDDGLHAISEDLFGALVEIAGVRRELRAVAREGGGRRVATAESPDAGLRTAARKVARVRARVEELRVRIRARKSPS